jgi:hypothetical protein
LVGTEGDGDGGVLDVDAVVIAEECLAVYAF